MKHILFLSLTIFCISLSLARADLSLKIGFVGLTGQNKTNFLMGVINRVKGNKIREDVFFEGVDVESKILNLDTGEEFKLSSDQKSAIKISFDQSALTNVIPIDAIKDTGKTETVNGCDAKIYNFSNFVGANYTLWVAKDFPHFEIIKKDLVKRDRLHLTTHSQGIHISTLPGMLLKYSINNSDTNASLLQVIVSEEPIDDLVFEVPKDYHFITTNEVISATNEPPTK